VAHSYQDLGDHLHTLAVEDETLVRSQDFDFEEVYRNVDSEEPEETTISMADASAAISIILGWICQSAKDEPASIKTVASKAESLLLLMDSNQSKYKSLADIARAAGLTRAALSKNLLSLKDQTGFRVIVGKLGGARDTFRSVQNALVANGRHASEKTRKRK
jgi:biotin operon repressor